jgi:hypothetical protein
MEKTIENLEKPSKMSNQVDLIQYLGYLWKLDLFVFKLYKYW